MNSKLRSSLVRSLALVMVLVLALPFSALAAASDEAVAAQQTTNWAGAIDIDGTELGIEISITADETGQLIGTFNIPQQGAFGIPLNDIAIDGNQISFKASALAGDPVFVGEVAEDGSVSGTYTQGGQSFPFAMALVTAPDVDEEPAEVEPPVIDAGLKSLEGLDKYIEGIMRDWGTPGTAVAVVQDGEIVYAKGFGIANIENRQQVTTQTQFAIGSATKAFATALISSFVDEGLVDWDVPVKNYIPGFELKDQLASNNVTLRDLVSHRTGLPRHDLALVFNPELTRKGIVDNLKSLEPSSSFRSTWQYNNYGYIVAAYALEQVTGQTWEQLMTERILAPLGMENSNLTVDEMLAAADSALGYEAGQKGLEKADLWNLGAASPAGSVNSDVLDMAKWIKFQLSGQANGQQIISPLQKAMMHAPQIPAASVLNDESIMFSSYGLGWMVESYRGNYFVHHGGNVPGYTAMVGLLPAKNAGVVVLSNTSGAVVPTLVTYNVVDRLLGLEPINHHKNLMEMVLAVSKQQAAAAAEAAKAPAPKVAKMTAEQLKAYTGTFVHPLYGSVNIRANDGSLVAEYYHLKMDLNHKNNDAFIANSEMIMGMEMSVQFQRAFNGSVEQVLLGFDPADKPLTFKRGQEIVPIDPAVFKQLPGTYEVMGVRFEIKLEGDNLYFLPQGQPPVMLKHVTGNKFNLVGLQGYSVDFLTNAAGKVTGMQINQPNGSFSGKRL